MTLPYSTRLTMPLTISPMRSLNSWYLAVALGLAHLLHDHLLGRLRGDAAIFQRRQRVGDGVADLRARIGAAGVFQRNLVRRVLDQLDHQHVARQPQLALLGVDFGVNVGFAAVAGAGRLGDGVLSIAAMTMPRSIDFSRATASAICSSSSLLALTAAMALVSSRGIDFASPRSFGGKTMFLGVVRGALSNAFGFSFGFGA